MIKGIYGVIGKKPNTNLSLYAQALAYILSDEWGKGAPLDFKVIFYGIKVYDTPPDFILRQQKDIQ